MSKGTYEADEKTLTITSNWGGFIKKTTYQSKEDFYHHIKLLEDWNKLTEDKDKEKHDKC